MKHLASTASLTACIALLCSYSQAAPVSASLVTSLEQRSSASNQISSQWQVTLHETIHASPILTSKGQLAKIHDNLIAEYKRRGFTDAAQMERMAAGVLQDVSEQAGTHTINNTVTWKFERHDQSTLVSGVSPETFDNTFLQFDQFYSGNTALIANQPKSEDKPGLTMTFDPVVWSTTGDSTNFVPPVSVGLSLLPEHFTFLAGQNPLNMYGASWQQVSTSATSWVLEGKVRQSSYGPLTIQLVLDRSHGNAPVNVVIKPDGAYWTHEWRTTGFQQNFGVWFPKRVTLLEHGAENTDDVATFVLEKVEKSQPLQLALSPKLLIHDYRLLGDDQTYSAISQAELHRSHTIVFYPWSGRIPSLEQLEQLHDKQHPGEANPDPAQSASLPFIGSLMALVGAVWLFRRRGNSA